MGSNGRTLHPLLLTVLALAGLVTLLAPAGAPRLSASPGAGADRALPTGPVASPTEAGQATFAAISEIVSILDNDPDTDWSRVDIAGLRDHLVDMHRVMVDAQVVQRPIDGGVEMTVGGDPAVVDAARRMVQAHAAMVGGMHGWTTDVADRGDALVVSWTTAQESEVVKLRALGFYGFLVDGSHHQQHHLMIARGMNPHGGGMR